MTESPETIIYKSDKYKDTYVLAAGRDGEFDVQRFVHGDLDVEYCLSATNTSALILNLLSYGYTRHYNITPATALTPEPCTHPEMSRFVAGYGKAGCYKCDSTDIDA